MDERRRGQCEAVNRIVSEAKSFSGGAGSGARFQKAVAQRPPARGRAGNRHAVLPTTQAIVKRLRLQEFVVNPASGSNRPAPFGSSASASTTGCLGGSPVSCRGPGFQILRRDISVSSTMSAAATICST